MVGGLWFPLGLLLRFQKTLMLPGPTATEILASFLPEIAVWLVGAGLLMIAAAVRGPIGLLWWPIFAVISAAYYAFSIAEYTYVEQTGMRLHFRTLKYGLLEFEQLKVIIQRVTGDAFFWRMAVALSLCLLGWLLWLVFRRFAEKVRPSLPWLFLGLGLGMLLIPMPERLRESGLAGTKIGELTRPVPSLEQLYADVPDSVKASLPDYRRPEWVPAVEGEEIGARPNLVLVILESTGAAIVPPYSDPEVWQELPAMARLAEESVVFDPVYSSITHTSKALVGILCGVFPRPVLDITEAAEGWPWPIECLPSLLQAAGYRAAFLQSAQQAFENRLTLVRNMGFTTAAFQETMLREPFQKLGYFSMDDRAMVEPALQWIGAGKKPFFLTLLTSAPHHPYDVPGLPVNRDETKFPAYYRAALKNQDLFLDELLQGIDALGQRENTLVVVVGDHGEAFGEHVGMQHNWVPYEEVVRVPLLMRGPGIGEARRVDRLSHHIDLMPTLLRLLGVSWQGELPGKDLFGEDRHSRVWSSCWGSRTCMSLREGDLKIVHHFGFRPTQFFDLSKDPLETRNLASTLPPEEKKRLEQELLARLHRVDKFWEAADTDYLQRSGLMDR